MPRNQRIGLVVAALAVAVIAFVVVRPDGEEDAGGQAAQTTPAETGAEPADPAETEPEPPPEPQVTRIELRAGKVVGGPRDLDVRSGDVVRIVVASDTPDEIHLHGYDLTRDAAPGAPARFRVKANLEGAFEMESHTAADAGRDPVVARLNVEPR